MSAETSSVGIAIEPCEDIALLSRLFLELAEDERSDVKRTEEKAYKDMASFLNHGKKAYAFTSGGSITGYALVDASRKPLYLNHFYICRSNRRKGFGTAAFELLLKTLDVSEMDLDVYAWNERGKAFWNSLGFKPRAVIMRLQP